MTLTDQQTVLIRLWAHTDWRYVATHFTTTTRVLRTPESICAPIGGRAHARIILSADCWHADHAGIWAGGPTATSSTHLVRWNTVFGWLADWPSADRADATAALAEFDAAVAIRDSEVVHPWQSPAQKQAARDRLRVRLEHGGYQAITRSRQTVQALIDNNLAPNIDRHQPALATDTGTSRRALLRAA